MEVLEVDMLQQLIARPSFFGIFVKAFFQKIQLQNHLNLESQIKRGYQMWNIIKQPRTLYARKMCR